MTPRTIPLSIALGVGILAATIYFAWALPAAAWVTDPVGFVPRLKMAAEIFTPIAVLVGLALAWKRTEIGDQQARTAQEQADLAEKGRVKKRISRAVGRLWDERLSVRLDGIYALERVARDSPKDHWTAMELLCSHVQAKRPIPETEGEAVPKEIQAIPKDIQAILTVLGRRDTSAEKPGARLGLSGTYLAGANLQHANLRFANLQGANFARANLIGVNLADAVLIGADLEGAFLEDSNLTDAILLGAKLEGVYLGGANLQGAEFLTQDQINEANGNSKTILPEGLTHPEHWKD